MSKKLLVCALTLCLAVKADSTLKSALGLEMDQARKTDAIEARYRLTFAAKRQEHNFEARKMRRAQTANDSQTFAAQEKIVNRLAGELRQMKMAEDEEIRKVLTPEQLKKFEAFIKLRNEMAGSSRDAHFFK